MSERGRGSSTETWMFIDLMLKTIFFTGGFNPAKTNRKLCNESTQFINAAGT